MLSYLRELGYRTASGDEVSRGLFHSDDIQKGLAKLLKVSKPIEPADLREHLWEDASLRRAVNRLMHPAILQRLQSVEADAFEIPLLIETCMQAHFQRVWVVTCGVDEQRCRLLQRVGDPEAVDSILGIQLSTLVKCAFADVVVRTNRRAEDVKRFVATMARRSLG